MKPSLRGRQAKSPDIYKIHPSPESDRSAYGVLIVFAFKALQELKVENEELKDRLGILENS